MKYATLLLSIVLILPVAAPGFKAQSQAKPRSAQQKTGQNTTLSSAAVASEATTTDALWAAFQKSTPSTYCFRHIDTNNPGPGTHTSYVNVTVSSDKLTFVQGGVLRLENMPFYYREEWTGTRQGDKIVAILTNARSRRRTEFVLDKKALSNVFLATNKNITYPIVSCSAKASVEIKDLRPVEALLAALRDADDMTRIRAMWALSERKEPRAVAPLLAAMTNDSKKLVRVQAIQALGRIKDARAVELLLAALQDTFDDIRWAAARALGDIQDGRAIEPLIIALRDKEEDVRDSAARALASIGKPAVEPLIVAATSTHVFTRTGAVRALGDIKDPRAVEPLIALLKKGPRDNYHDIPRLSMVLAAFGEPAVEPLIVALKDTDERIRFVAAWALEAIQGDRAVEALMAALWNKDMTVIYAAHKFFIRRGDTGSEDALCQTLRKHGTDDMALNFVHSGNDKLSAAANEWFRSKGIQPSSSPQRRELRWGSARK